MVDSEGKVPEGVVPAEKRIPDKTFNEIKESVPLYSVDLVVVKDLETDPQVLLIKRKIPPGVGKWALVGGRVLKGERLKEAIDRQAKIELGVSVEVIPPFNANQSVATFDNPDVVSGMHPIIGVYPVEIVGGQIKKSGPESEEIRWFPLDQIPDDMGFDHREEVFIALYSLYKNGRLRLP